MTTTTLKFHGKARDLDAPVGETTKGFPIYAFVMPSTGRLHLLAPKGRSGKAAEQAREVKADEVAAIDRKVAEAKAAALAAWAAEAEADNSDWGFRTAATVRGWATTLLAAARD